MKTITIYPIIRMEIEVPDDYEGTIENDIRLAADFGETEFDIEGCKMGEVELCGWNDEPSMFTEQLN